MATSICWTSPTSIASNENVSMDPGWNHFFFPRNSSHWLPVWRFFVPRMLMCAFASVPIARSEPVVIFTVYGIAANSKHISHWKNPRFKTKQLDFLFSFKFSKCFKKVSKSFFLLHKIMTQEKHLIRHTLLWVNDVRNEDILILMS